MKKYDVVIIGGAAAGLTAAIYASRRALKTLVITKTLGGQAAITTEIENYPGTGNIPGPQLMTKFESQARSFGAEIQIGEVSAIEKKTTSFIVKSTLGDFEALSVILAFGLTHRELNLPGEKKLVGRGVTYCATCDGPLFKNKIVGVVGGGNSAFDAADYLSEMCEKVYLFVRTDKYRAEQVLIDSVKNAANVEIRNFTEIKEIIGDKKLEKVIVKNNQTNEEEEIALRGVFVEVGWQTQIDFIRDLVIVNDHGYVVIYNEAKTSAPGIFAGGDITDTPFKQVVISAGEGAKAALSAARYLQQMSPSKEERQDWTRRKGSKLN
jgi:thioredoxin-disulfide reductase